MKKGKLIPGTVSKILWHFTGGPEWDSNLNCQKPDPKDPEKAFDNLVAILEVKELRTGKYKEFVEAKFDQLKVVPLKNEERLRVKIEPNSPYTIESCPVCCLADIPIQHLVYHSQRYGKFAIGFYRDAAIKAGFNPVLYTLSNEKILNEFATALNSTVSSCNLLENFYRILDSFLNELDSIKNDQTKKIKSEYLSFLENNLDNIHFNIDDAKKNLSVFLAYIKSFKKEEFGTIYCEREWRSINSFKFDYDDVAMILLPKDENNINYFERFYKYELKKLDFLRNIPIIPWEDLLEY